MKEIAVSVMLRMICKDTFSISDEDDDHRKKIIVF